MINKVILLVAILTSTLVASAVPAEEPAAVCEQALTKAQQAWALNDWREVRSALDSIISATNMPARWRSLAQLRLARSYQAKGNHAAAGSVFVSIAANKLYPQVHRDEAAECRVEVERLAKGLPARDPEESRVRVPPVPTRGRVLHVAPTGSDAGDGSALRPFVSLVKALEANRAAGAVSGGTLFSPFSHV